MSDRWTDLLSDYVDDDLDAAARIDLEAHLRTCAECAAAVDDLRGIVARARTLGGEEPDRDLWPGIEARIRAAATDRPTGRRGGWSGRRVSFSLPELAAACLAIAVLSGGAVWYARTSGLRDAARVAARLAEAPRARGGPLSSALGEDAPSAGASRSASTASTASGQVGEGVEELRRILAGGRDKLDPSTVRTLEESLNAIDVAIREARRALDADPHNPYVRAHLDDTVRRRMELLNRATMLASAPR